MLPILYRILLPITLFLASSIEVDNSSNIIVGTWQISEENRATLTQKHRYIQQVYFSSNQLTSILVFSNKRGEIKKKELRLAYKIYDFSPEYLRPIISFISTCDDHFKLTFTIEKLTKDSLELKWIRDLTSRDITLNREMLTFERIAGPPENMPETDEGSPEIIENLRI